MSPADAVLIAWQRWDAMALRAPRRPDASFLKFETDRLEDACQALAALHGITCLDLRQRMAANRRAGLDYDVALKEALGAES